jgi:hypothetical protein
MMFTDLTATKKVTPAVILMKARHLALGGADHVKVMAPHCTREELEAGLEYARFHKGSKTLIQAFEREIKKKVKA